MTPSDKAALTDCITICRRDRKRADQIDSMQIARRLHGVENLIEARGALARPFDRLLVQRQDNADRLRALLDRRGKMSHVLASFDAGNNAPGIVNVTRPSRRQFSPRSTSIYCRCSSTELSL